MEQKKISQCDTMTVSLDNSYPDAYLAAVNKDSGTFKNFKLSVASLVSALNNKFATINSKFTTINNKFTAVNSRIDAIAAGGSSGGGSGSGGSSEDPGEDPGEGGEGSGEGGGTTPSGLTTDLTEVNNRLQVLENEISNFKNVNNWPTNTIILKNSAGAEIARYDLPSNYLGTGYTGDNSIVINVNSSAAPKFTIEMGLGMWSVSSTGVSVPISVQYYSASGQLGGTIQSLQVQGSFKTTSTTIPAANLNYITESTNVTSTTVTDTKTMSIELPNADLSVITLTAELYLDGGSTPIIALSSTWLGGADTPSRKYIVTT